MVLLQVALITKYLVMYESTFTLRSSHPLQLIDITTQLTHHLDLSGVKTGVYYVFIPHTTAGVTINEGADPDVQTDFLHSINNMVPTDIPYKHKEGNSRSHIMASLVGSSIQLLVSNSNLFLGTLQRIFFCEFDGPRERKIHCRIITQF